MATIGRILLMPKGTYSGSTVYNSLDWVRYNGSSWVCKVDGTVGITPSESANWTLMAADGSVSGAVEWSNVNYKPFETIDSSDFAVDGSDELSIKRDTFGVVRVKSGGTTTDLEASGDSIVQIEAGTNVTIAADDTTNPKKLVINSSGSGATDLDDLSDVNITSVSNGQVLTYDSSSSKWKNANASGGASDLDDLTDVTITTPSNNQVLQYDSSASKWKNQTFTGGHNMIDNANLISDMNTAIAEGTSNDDVVSAYGVGTWSNCDALVIYTTAAKDADTVGQWDDDWTTAPVDRTGWLWHKDLYNVLSNNNITIEVVFDIGASETVGLAAYRIDDNYQSGGVNGGCVAFKFTAPIQNALGVKVGLKLINQRTKTVQVTPLA